MHDKTTIKFSMKFVNFLNGLPPGVVIIGDAAYRDFHPRVIVPYTGNLNEREASYERIASLRQIVKRSTGALQTKWRVLQLKESRLPSKFNVTFASKCFIAAFVCFLACVIAYAAYTFCSLLKVLMFASYLYFCFIADSDHLITIYRPSI